MNHITDLVVAVLILTRDSNIGFKLLSVGVRHMELRALAYPIPPAVVARRFTQDTHAISTLAIFHPVVTSYPSPPHWL